MPQYFVTLDGGAFCLVEHRSIDDLMLDIDRPDGRGMVRLLRPDAKPVLLRSEAVVLVQPPAPPAFLRNPPSDKENPA